MGFIVFFNSVVAVHVAVSESKDKGGTDGLQFVGGYSILN
jgi:hypothetical protein